MKIAILEDNYYFQEKIKNLLNVNRHLIHVYSDIDSYDLSSVYYDLLLLDIHLHKENGIEYIKKHEYKQLFVIYISNHEECMIDTFDTNVLGFIPKKDMDVMLSEKIQFVESKIKKMNRIQLSVLGGKILLREKEILIIYLSEGNMYITLENGKEYRLVYETLKEVQKVLPDGFIRVNNGCIVNGRRIKKLDNKTHVIYLSDNKEIQVSRRKWRDIKNLYIEMKMNI